MSHRQIEQEGKRGIKPWKVGIIQFIGVVLLPAALDTERGISFVSFAWRVDFTVTGPVFTYFHIQYLNNPFLWVSFFAAIIFVRQMVRLYEQKTTGKRTFLAYLVGILPLIIFSVGNTLPILWEPRWPALVVIPLPLVLVLALITIFFYPPPGPLRVWIDKEEEISWWKDKQYPKEP
ncbi:MAG: hypothetical protein ACXAEB_12895 [Candidatus Thorarchaeota archaeon]|jgi:hypothetical protein